MKHLLFFLVLFSGQAYSQSGDGVIMGNVIDIRHKPIQSLNIKVLINDVSRFETQTGADGKFRTVIPHGSYSVLIESASGEYLPFKVDKINVSSDRITFLDDIILLKPGEELKGRDKKKRKK